MSFILGIENDADLAAAGLLGAARTVQATRGSAGRIDHGEGPSTTTWCGRWHVAARDDSCVAICVRSQIPTELFFQVNAGLGTSIAGRTANLVAGRVYCEVPRYDWNHPAVSMTFTDGGYTLAISVADPTSIPTVTSESASSRTSSAAIATTTTSAPLAPYHSYGCYSEGASSRALTGHMLRDTEGMTVELCAQTYYDLSFGVFGVEGGMGCYCGGRGTLELYRFGDGSQPPPASTLPAGYTGFAFYGCSSTKGARDYPALEGKRIGNAAAMTVEARAYFCLDNRYPMFGLGNGSDCVCGYGVVAGASWFPDAECKTPCSGNATQTCGASDRLSIYEWMQG